MIHLGSLVLGDLGKLRLDGAALIVDALELRRELARFVEVVAHQKIERELRVAHATSRVQTGNERSWRLLAVSALPAAPVEPSSAAMQGRGRAFMHASPSATKARFSPPTMGMRSATVPSVAKSV